MSFCPAKCTWVCFAGFYLRDTCMALQVSASMILHEEGYRVKDFKEI